MTKNKQTSLIDRGLDKFNQFLGNELADEPLISSQDLDARHATG